MNEALRLGPERAFVQWVAGEVKTLQREYDAAIEHYTRALQLDPEYYVALFDRAATNLYARRPADSRRDLQAAAQRTILNVDRAFARRAEALTWLHEGKLDEAIAQMTRVAVELEREGAWRTQLALAHRHLSILAAARKDPAAVERHIAAQKGVYEDDGPGGMYFWNTIALALSGRPARAREELAAYEKLVASRDHRPAAAEVAAVNATVLVAESRHEEALTAAGTSANHWAMLARYHALTRLGRTSEATAELNRLLNANNYALDGMALPVARLLHGPR
jgi:tetratricopeptide (TPR) repeat protein